MKLPAFLAIVTASAFLLTSCTPRTPTVTNGAPPAVACGTVLEASAAGAVVYDATRPLPTIEYTSVGGRLFFRVARGCDHGSNVSWLPSSAARLVKAARARDGLPAAIVLQPSSPRATFQLTAVRDGKVVASAAVRLSP
jgi:hypothetical protein